jgi:hypothetical protein
VAELRERTGRDGFPPVLIVHMGSPEEGERFFAERWPEARAVSDETKDLYAAFSLRRGTVGQLLGPKVWVAGLKAALGGYGLGAPVGDPLMLSGWYLVRGGEVLWHHRHEHAGAERRWGELEEAYRRSAGGAEAA